MATKEVQAVPAVDVEALKAQLRDELRDELKAELQKATPPASTGSFTVPARDPWLEEYVQVQLFKDGKDYKDDVFVSVNGENCRIQRGVPVKIKRKFALVLEQSEKQDIAANEYAERRQQEYAADAIRFNL